MKLGWQASKWLKKKAKAGFRGYPAGTVAFYGPDDQRASKVAVGSYQRRVSSQPTCADGLPRAATYGTHTLAGA